jgi:hypothetical protein
LAISVGLRVASHVTYASSRAYVASWQDAYITGAYGAGQQYSFSEIPFS